jgi:hypothetical protein
MTIESVHFIVGKLMEIGMKDDGTRSFTELTVQGTACRGGPCLHKITFLDTEKTGESLLSGIEISDTILAEVDGFRFLSGAPGGGPGHFASYLVGILEKAPKPSAPSLHFVRATFTGMAPSAERGTDMQFRERCPGNREGSDYVFRLTGRRLKHVLEAKLRRGEDILLRTTQARPLARGADGRAELTGNGLEFFRIGIESVKPFAPSRSGGGDPPAAAPA